jgi:hypothetical protein
MKMTLIPQASAAALLLILTLCLQCAGVAALVEWLRGVTAKDGQGFGPVRSAVLGPLESMAGVLMCGVSVCLLFATITRLVERDRRDSRKLGYANDPVNLKENCHASKQNYV